MNITVSKQESIYDGVLIIDDLNKKIYIYKDEEFEKNKINYSLVNYSEITGCQVFLGNDATSIDSLGILTNTIEAEEEINKGGIVIITDDILNPRIEIKFFNKRKKRKNCTSQIRKITEWATIINNIAEKNKVHAV